MHPTTTQITATRLTTTQLAALHVAATARAAQHPEATPPTPTHVSTTPAVRTHLPTYTSPMGASVDKVAIELAGVVDASVASSPVDAFDPGKT